MPNGHAHRGVVVMHQLALGREFDEMLVGIARALLRRITNPFPLMRCGERNPRRPHAVAEDEGPAVHRVTLKLGAADGGQAVDPLAEIDRLDRHQDPHGRSGLDHPSLLPEHAAKQHGLQTIALVGAKRGRMAEVADQVIVINDTHYGRVEDAQMGIFHLLCYAFMEHPEWAQPGTDSSS